jgi:hypothetical protein
MGGKKTSMQRSKTLLNIIHENKLTKRSQILCDEVLERVIRKDSGFMRFGGCQVEKEIVKFRKLCWNKSSIPYKLIFEGKVVLQLK